MTILPSNPESALEPPEPTVHHITEEYRAKLRADSRKRFEWAFACYIVGCIAHVQAIEMADDFQHWMDFQVATRIVAACLSQMPDHDGDYHAELPFNW